MFLSLAKINFPNGENYVVLYSQDFLPVEDAWGHRTQARNVWGQVFLQDLGSMQHEYKMCLMETTYSNNNHDL